MYDPDAPQSQPGQQPEGNPSEQPAQPEQPTQPAQPAQPSEPEKPSTPPSGYPIYQGIPEKGPTKEEEAPQPYVPSAPASYTSGRASGGQMRATKKPRGGSKSPLILALIIIVGLLLAYAVIANRSSQQLSSTLSSTVANIKVGAISSCGKISAPGQYYLTKSLSTKAQSGACINVTSSDVAIQCNQNKITGSGPYSGVGPFSYGIGVMNQSNVTISNCAISNFSYGVLLSGVSSSTVKANNLSSNYMSNLYMARTSDSNVSSNYMSHSASPQGSIFITNGSSNNKISNNTVEYDAYYGININSTGNTYLNNYVNSSEQSSFYCSVIGSYPDSSAAQSNLCYTNQGCGFLKCRGTNTPANITKPTLSSTINSCGTINTPGTYTLARNIDVSKLINTSDSSVSSYNMPCIKVAADYATLQCNGFTISNATIGILAQNRTNVTISNCKVSGSDTGISLASVENSTIFNTTLHGDKVALLMVSSNSNLVSDIKASNGDYGALISDSDENVFSQYNFSFNKYGLHATSAQSNIFNNGFLFNNSILDVYASVDSANASNDTMQLTSCGLTNAEWATCTNRISINATYRPINSCGTIGKAGNYTLSSSLINAQSNCMKIAASDVALNCQGDLISASQSATGSAIWIHDANNVTVRNCRVSGFDMGINVTNAKLVNITNISIQLSKDGIKFQNVSSSTLDNNTFNRTENTGITLTDVSSSRMTNNTVFQQKGNRSVALVLNNSKGNIVLNNTASQSYIGLELNGSSFNNAISNNTMQLSAAYDYACNGNYDLASENGGINYGTTKNNCPWLAVIPPAAVKQECSVSFEPNIYEITLDQAYTFGARCYGVFANHTTINCNGHTIIATNGGTFAYFQNSTGSVIRNCILKGFTAPIVTHDSGVTVQNNTILDIGSSTTGIDVSGGNSSYVMQLKQNNILNATTGILLHHTHDGSLVENNVSKAQTAYSLKNVSYYTLTNNTATASTITGINFANSTYNLLQDNKLYSSTYGMLCDSVSASNSSNVDLGGNYCSVKSDCSWVSSSRSC